jgi:L-serine deaminase
VHAQLEQIVHQRLQELQQQAEDAKSAVAAATTARDQAQQQLQQAQAQMGDATHAVNGAANRGARRSKIAATRPLGWRARPANPPWRRRGSYRFPPDRS